MSKQFIFETIKSENIVKEIDYKEINKKVYHGCVGKYSKLAITTEQILLIQKLVKNYKISVRAYDTRKQATDAIHKIYDGIHNNKVKLRPNRNCGHVEVINDVYTFVLDNEEA